MAFEACSWLNEPGKWHLLGEELQVVSDGRSDFWRETFYGFTRDSGHLFARRITGDFTAQIRVRANYQTLYDQAGLMVRVDEQRWIKAGIELSDGRAMLSSVLTAGQSDWATAPYLYEAGDFWLRVTLADGALRLQVSADGKFWPLFRLCPFAPAGHYLVGPMCCTPERDGLEVRFSDFWTGPALGKDLHDLS